MVLTADIEKSMPRFSLNVRFSCTPGKLLCIVGPSGAGKTTAIRLIAGLEKLDGGSILYGNETWADANKKIHLTPQKRCLGYVFQEYTLFPHLNVYRNIAFAARDSGKVKELLERFGISHIRDRLPNAISGGERQRCAICQALARNPRVLLLDEPFSALDLDIRRALRRDLLTIKNSLSIPIIHVTHDLNEALFLADDIVPIVNGETSWSWFLRHLKEGIDEDVGAAKKHWREAIEQKYQLNRDERKSTGVLR